MKDLGVKRRRTGIANQVRPTPQNGVVELLARFGVPSQEIIGWKYRGDELTDLGDKYRDYTIVFFGVSDQALATRIFLEDGQNEILFCWQIQIYWKERYDGFIEAMWSAHTSDFLIKVEMGRLDTLSLADSKHLVDGLVLMQWIQERLEETRGGDRNPREIHDLWSDENCIRFAEMVKELLPKWSWAKTNDYDEEFSTPAEWVSEVRQRNGFSALFGDCLALTDDLLLRITDNKLDKADKEPLALACVHAAAELGIAEIYQECGRGLAASTLRNYYRKGLELQRRNRG